MKTRFSKSPYAPWASTFRSRSMKRWLSGPGRLVLTRETRGVVAAMG